MKIGFLGGGSFGNNLAELLARQGLDVVVGLRDPGRPRANAPSYRIGSLEDAAKFGEVVIIAIPYLSCADVLPRLSDILAGKVVIDSTNPLREDWSPLPFDRDNSAGEEIARLLPSSRVVKSFNTIFADIITRERIVLGGFPVTAFIAGDDAVANSIAARIAAAAGFAPLVTGRLSNSRYLESMAHLNIQIAVVQGGGTNAGYVYHSRRNNGFAQSNEEEL